MNKLDFENLKICPICAGAITYASEVMSMKNCDDCVNFYTSIDAYGNINYIQYVINKVKYIAYEFGTIIN